MFRSIQWRITIPFVILILVSMGILGAYLVNFTRDYQVDILRSQLGNEARIIAEASLPVFRSADKQVTLDAMAKALGRDIETRVTIVAPDGAVLGDSEEDPVNMENHAARPEIKDAISADLGVSTRYSTTLGVKMIYVAVPVSYQGEVLGIVRVALPLSEVESLAHRITVSIATATAIAALLVILAAWLIARVTTRSIRKITTASREIASGELGQKIFIDTGDEVEELAHSYNEMSLKLKALVDTISGDKSRFETILENMADGVIMTDNEGNITLANIAARKIFGIEDAVDKPLIEAVRDYELNELLKLCIQTVKAQETQYESGISKKFLRVIAVPITSYRPKGFLILFQDLTDMRALQTTRRELIGNISHEFRTPLAGIKAMVETLRSGAVDDKAVAADFLTRIDEEVNRLAQMVDELIELTRIETGKAGLRIATTDVNMLIEEVINHLSPQAERQQISIRKELAGDLPAINSDAGRIKQVIINLVHNAIKFTPPGGKITISSRYDDTHVTVDVSDTGTGISRRDLPHIFERFYKADRARSSGGTGMGLAIAKHVIEAHGGSIRAQSHEGKGSTLSFNLPRRGPSVD